MKPIGDIKITIPLLIVTHGPWHMRTFVCLNHFVEQSVSRRTHWLFGFIPVWTKLWTE